MDDSERLEKIVYMQIALQQLDLLKEPFRIQPAFPVFARFLSKLDLVSPKRHGLQLLFTKEMTTLHKIPPKALSGSFVYHGRERPPVPYGP